MTLDCIVHESHRRVVTALLAELQDHPAVLGVLLIGSLGRGTALPGSDVDLLVLLADGQGTTRLFANHERHNILVEYHFRDDVAAREQLVEHPTWCYAYMNSQLLLDTDGRLANLVTFAEQQFLVYRAPAQQKRRYAFMVDRTRHKLQAALDANDLLRAGGVASTYAGVILDGLWTAHDRPRLGVSEMWVRLPDLTDFPAALIEQLHLLFVGAARDRAQAGVLLCAWILDHLGGPVIDPYAE